MNLIPMQFENANIRIVTDESGEPWFVGKDVAEALGYADPTNAMKQHCKGVVKRHPLSTAGGMQEVRVLSEPDVLRLIVRSTLPAAERFERWVFEDVLPTIRKTGGYGNPAVDPMRVLNDPVAMRGLLLTYSEKMIALEGQVAEQAPKVEALALLTEADGALALTDAAKVLEMPRDRFIRWVHALGWIYRRPGRGEWTAHCAAEKAGRVVVKISPFVNSKTGETEVSHTVRITPKGMGQLALLKLQRNGGVEDGVA